MPSHSLKTLKHFHKEAIQFFGAELMLMKDVLPEIKDGKLDKPAILLISCGQTGEALIHLAVHVDTFSGQTVMLARAFMEAITNFVYLGICDEKEYRAFMLHPLYRQYHNVRLTQMEDDWDAENIGTHLKAKEGKQKELKEIPIVREALAMFSETKSHLNWTKTSLGDRIDAINKWGKLLDVFFTLCKNRYYSDASEVIHGSLYGCTYGIGALEREFDHTNTEKLEKKLYRDNICVLLHLGMLVHEAFTLISYTNKIKKIWDHSFRNRNQALNFLYLVQEKKIPGFDEEQNRAFAEYFRRR
jgi:hypothetical protein